MTSRAHPTPTGLPQPIMVSLALALIYMAVWHQPPSVALALLKASAVAALAVYAASQARDVDGRLIAVVLSFGALGDALLEWRLEAGAGAFIIGHALAMLLYFRNWRVLTFAARVPAPLLVGASVGLAALLVPPARMTGVAVYAFFVSGMAASAWTSRFPRNRVALGAALFLASDMLIFARMGPLAGQAWVNIAVWVLYIAGQVLICLGVTRTLATGKPR